MVTQYFKTTHGRTSLAWIRSIFMCFDHNPVSRNPPRSHQRLFQIKCIGHASQSVNLIEILIDVDLVRTICAVSMEE